MNETNLISAREEIARKLEALFDDKVVEAHLLGSLARGDADAYSDIDIWYVFKDETFGGIFEERFSYYARLGTVVHSCEPPQNSPIGGVHTALLIERNDVITVVDIYLCPLSTAFITKESKKLFGIDLPDGEAGFNPHKVQVDEKYRIDFFISFVFNTIKKLARNEESPLEAVFREYENLYTNYKISVVPLDSKEEDLNTLEKIIKNIEIVSNKKQKEAFIKIQDFARKILQ